VGVSVLVGVEVGALVGVGDGVFVAVGIGVLAGAGALSYELEGKDRYNQCSAFHLCNGGGACSLFAKRVFISSGSYNGNLGGLSGADQECQDLAATASLSGTWKAWLSNNTASAGGRLTHSTYPYILTDKMTKIADDWLDLTSASLSAVINQTESGATISAERQVWTNTTANGSIVSTSNILTCLNFTSSARLRFGRYGTNTLYTSGSWTNNAYGQCNQSRCLYCFEQ